MKSFIKISVFIAIIIPASIYHADAGYFSDTEAGTVSAQFLKLGVGARPIAMGEAYAGLADTADTVYWNPAGMSLLLRKELATMYSHWFEGIYFANATYVSPTDIGGLGVSVDYICSGAIDMYDNENNELGEQYSAYDVAVTMSIARKIKTTYSGMNLKLIYSFLEEESAVAFCVDMGILREITKRISFGVVVQNLGTKIRYVNESASLPLNIKTGLSCKLLKKSLILATDVNFPIDNEMRVNYGLEYNINMGPIKIAPRIGYKNTTLSKMHSRSGLSAGCGWNHRDYSINYAWVPYWKFGNTHRISINIRFGGIQ